jgi:hypothetical protein
MNDNDHIAEKITVEQVGRNAFQVFRDGKPVTGPLSPLEANKVAETLDASSREIRISKSFALGIVLTLSVLTVIVSTIITGEISTGILFGGVVFVMMSIGVLWRVGM